MSAEDRRKAPPWLPPLLVVLAVAAGFAAFPVMQWFADRPSAQEAADARTVAEARAKHEREQAAEGLVPARSPDGPPLSPPPPR